ncbi:Multicopper oxidase [Aspergillus sclerotialis]|uniref:Multicopper oxidase n=1 Tax=Aspergillus sclerotialis TaxID=2070753 RepID=A0A3A2Z5J9_9EURO|nr:Multicopper oxidase [Aspergillus sclerotialis]
MERQSSRRRRSGPLAKSQKQDTENHEETIPHGPQKSSSFQGVVIYSLVVCVWIILAYFHQNNTPDPLQSLLPFPRIQGKKNTTLRDPDSVRPRIELHPEDHVYREPVTQRLGWRVTSDYLRPDGVLKRVYLVNGLFPGPTIETRSGDILVISVTNALETESITIHWHGLHIQNSMDGTSGVTQSVIPPGDEFVYNFTIPMDQSGTFWYHAHSGVHRADGLYGGFVVHEPAPKSTVRGLLSKEAKYAYEKELLLLIGDWYHRPADQVLAWYMRAASDGNEPVSDSLLINGVGSFDCNMAVPARPVDCEQSQVDFSFLNVNRNVDYRIRVVNTGSLAGFTLTFEHEKLELIQLDGIDVEPQRQKNVNSAGILYPGQRMDFILRSPPEVDAKPSSSITVGLDPECFKYPNPALNPEQSFPINKISKDNRAAKPSWVNSISLDQVASSSSNLAALPAKADQAHVIYTKIQKLSINEYIPYGFFNQSSWKPSDIPLIDLPKEKWGKDQFSFSTGPEPIWVDLVVNNLDEGPHPFHLHGHHFYILTVHQASIGWGSYNPFRDPYPPGLMSNSKEVSSDFNSETPYNLSRAILRDTVQIPSRGYAVLRFRADNPGVWMFHCHILWHLASGMAMLVNVMRV